MRLFKKKKKVSEPILDMEEVWRKKEREKEENAKVKTWRLEQAEKVVQFLKEHKDKAFTEAYLRERGFTTDNGGDVIGLREIASELSDSRFPVEGITTVYHGREERYYTHEGTYYKREKELYEKYHYE